MTVLAQGKILVIGASGLAGRRLTTALLAEGRAVRCLARNPVRVADLAVAGCEIVQGDIADSLAVQRAMESVQAVYISIHTLSPQPGGGARARFMDIETSGVRNVLAACRSHGAHRVIYVTSFGVAPDAPSEWLRERWRTEQLLLNSGLDATVIRPGMIVGVGGQGFDTVVSQAKRRVAITLGGNRPKMRSIALDDLVTYLVGILDEPRTYGECYEVGNEDIFSMNEMIDLVADMLGHRHPVKTQIPRGLLGALAPLVERMTKLPKGAVKGFLQSLQADSVGDPMPIRAILPRQLLSFRQAAERALTINQRT